MLNNDKKTLLSIMEAIDKIENYTSSFKNADDFFSNSINFDAVMMNFIIIGEMISRLSDSLRNEYCHVD